MKIDTDVVTGQLDAALEAYDDLRSKSQYDDLSDLSGPQVTRTITLIAASIERLAPSGSIYREQANALLKKYGGDDAEAATHLIGVALALRADYAAGRLQALQELIHADLFSDFLGMALHLLDDGGYKDPAAVLVGGVLEGHLRQLATKVGISTDAGGRPKKAETLNSELTAQTVYSKLDQKSVTSWLDLRNRAAHGKYGEYTKEQVALTLQSVRDFITRHPA